MRNDKWISRSILAASACVGALAVGCSSAPAGDQAASHDEAFVRGPGLPPPPPALQVCPMPSVHSGCTSRIQGYLVPAPANGVCPDIDLPGLSAVWRADSYPTSYLIAVPRLPGGQQFCSYTFDGIEDLDGLPMSATPPASAICHVFQWKTQGSYVLPADPTAGPAPLACTAPRGFVPASYCAALNNTWMQSCKYTPSPATNPEKNGGCDTCLN